MCDRSLWFFFFKQKTAYEMRISDWSSDVCSSDLPEEQIQALLQGAHQVLLFGYPDAPVQALLGALQKQAQPAVLLVPSGVCPALVRGQQGTEIGRASCRESVSVRVDLGGRRIIKKKNNKMIQTRNKK